MNSDDTSDQDEASKDERPLSPAAQRALDEAAARRAGAKSDGAPNERPTEIGGRDGPDPTRYGDWEKKGLISDF